MKHPNTPDRRARAGGARVIFRRLVLGAFAVTTAVIAVLVGEAVFSGVGWISDPHGYGVIFGILCAAVLTPVALALWMLYQWIRRPGS
jgi:hypothetical protein